MSESPNLIPAEQPPQRENETSKKPEIEKKSENQQEQTQTETHTPTAPTKTILTDDTPALGDETYTQVEELLSRDLEEYYEQMNPQEQERFATTGEKVAREISTMLDQGKTSFKKFVQLISNWLKLIPGVNKFFLEKESKKRADALISKHEEDNGTPGLFGVMLFQAGGLFNGAGETVGNQSTNIVNQLMLIGGIVVVSIITIILLVVIVRRNLRRKHDFGPSAHLVTLLITIPKEQQLKDKAGDVGIDAIRAQISIGEQFLNTIGNMKAQKGFFAWLFGRSDHLAFEIVAQGGLIYFYIVVPKGIRTSIEEQLQAQYPAIQIEEVDDYNFFKPKDVVLGAALKFSRSFTYPIKTYQETETDPLNSILTPLTKVGEDAGVAIQYIVRSAHKKWRGHSKRVGKEISEGKQGKKGIGSHLSSAISYSVGSESKQEGPKESYTPTQMGQESIKKIDEKQSRAGLDCNIRIVVSAPQDNTAQIILKNVLSGYSQFTLFKVGNSFKADVPKKPAKLINQFIYRQYDDKKHLLVNTEELASLWHVPTPFLEVPNIKWLTSRSAPPPPNMATEGVTLGYNIYRRVRTDARMKVKDRRRHLYAIGMTGVGKSTLLSNMANQDVKLGNGFCIMDPHGDLAEDIIGAVPPERIDDVVYFNPADTARPMGMNILEFDESKPEQKAFVVNEFYNILDRLYDLKATGGPMFETYLKNAILLNMSHPESGNTIMEIPKVLADEEFRNFKLSKCNIQVVKDFWIKEAGQAGGEASLQNMVPYITTKLNQFISNDIMRPIIGQQESSLDMRDIMDNKKILLVNLSKGKLGDKNSNLLGLILIGKILQAALGRTDTPEDQRVDFNMYIDEFQNYLTDTVATILSEARKYRLILNVAHQYIGQLEEMPAIKDAIFGNVGTKVAFRVGVEDAEFLAAEFAPTFNQFDLMNIDARNAYIKLMVDGAAARPFNIATYPPPDSDPELREALIEISRLTYGRDREIVEREIKQRSGVK